MMRNILLLAVLALAGCAKSSDGADAKTPDYTAMIVNGREVYSFSPDGMPGVKCVLVDGLKSTAIWCKESKQ